MILGYPFSEEKLWVKNELARLWFSIEIPAKMRNFRSETSFYASKSAITAKIGKTLSKPGPVGRWFSTIGHANVPTVTTSPKIESNFGETGKKNRRLRVKNLGGFLKCPRFPATRNFPG